MAKTIELCKVHSLIQNKVLTKTILTVFWRHDVYSLLLLVGSFIYCSPEFFLIFKQKMRDFIYFYCEKPLAGVELPRQVAPCYSMNTDMCEQRY